MDSGFGNDVGVEAVAKINGVDVIAFKVRVPKLNQDVSVRTTTERRSLIGSRGGWQLDMCTNIMVKKTWRNRLTAFNNTARRYSHASPDMMISGCFFLSLVVSSLIKRVIREDVGEGKD